MGKTPLLSLGPLWHGLIRILKRGKGSHEPLEERTIEIERGGRHQLSLGSEDYAPLVRTIGSHKAQCRALLLEPYPGLSKSRPYL